MASSADQNLTLQQTLGMRLSQQQLRFVRMLEMTAPELDEAVESELEANPALIETEPGEIKETEPVAAATTRNYYTGSDRDDTPEYVQPDTSYSLYDSLLEQLGERDLRPDVRWAAEYIIRSLDPNGYLDRSLQALVNDMAFNHGRDIAPDDATEALDVVRSLDPAGIGAADLQDSLRLQLRRMAPSTRRDDALEIIDKTFEEFKMKHWHKIVSRLRIPSDRVDAALELIRSLNPKPGGVLGNDTADMANAIIPDFIVSNEGGELNIMLNNRIPELRIDTSFTQAMEEIAAAPRGKARKGNEFIINSYNDARDFIRILSQRQETMLKVITAIVSIQKEYFETGDIYTLKPMMIKNVADITGQDFSVISRATNNKYVSLPWGVYPLRFFFSDSVGSTDEGMDAATNRKIEAEISAVIEAEDKRHPLSDQKIMEEMARRGYDISRRTVTKYRDRKQIPVARLRKEN